MCRPPCFQWDSSGRQTKDLSLNGSLADFTVLLPCCFWKRWWASPTSLCMKNRRCALRVCVPENKCLETQNLVYFHYCLSLVTRKISCNSVAVKAATNVAESAPYCFWARNWARIWTPRSLWVPSAQGSLQFYERKCIWWLSYEQNSSNSKSSSWRCRAVPVPCLDHVAFSRCSSLQNVSDPINISRLVFVYLFAFKSNGLFEACMCWVYQLVVWQSNAETWWCPGGVLVLHTLWTCLIEAHALCCHLMTWALGLSWLTCCWVSLSGTQHREVGLFSKEGTDGEFWRVPCWHLKAFGWLLCYQVDYVLRLVMC